MDFYVSCTEASSTCQEKAVGVDKNGNGIFALVQGVTDSKGNFTATEVGNGPNNTLQDNTTGTGTYTATTDSVGVHFSQNGGKTSLGIFANGTSPTDIQGTGDFAGFNFTFTNSKLESNQTAAGTFTFNGTETQAGQALLRAGFVSMGWLGANKGFDEFRSTGTGLFGENSAHFNIQQVKTTPSSTIPASTTGNMHFGEHFPLSLGIIDHILESR